MTVPGRPMAIVLSATRDHDHAFTRPDPSLSWRSEQKDVPSKQDIKDLAPRIPGKKEDPVPRVGPFWESKLFKEGG